MESLYLENNRLNVSVSFPGTFYSGSRFDWNGFITEIVLDKNHKFCMPESLIKGKGTGGYGLCNEFGIDEAIGYDEIDSGEFFPKIGVGLLKKSNNEPYDFFNNYEIIPFKAEILREDNSILLKHEPIMCNGYSFYYEKKISILENSLIIEYFLKNTGNKHISTSEYCHNFFSIDGESIGQNYIVNFPYEIKASNVVGKIEFKNNMVTWNSKDLQEFYCNISGNKENKHKFDIVNKNKNLAIREIDDFYVYKVALWGSSHVVCPETFIKIDISKGQKVSWKRKYEFYNVES